MSNVNLERLKAEEAELEAQMLGKPEVPTSTPDTTELTTQEELEAAKAMEDIIVQPSEIPEVVVEPVPEKKKRENWKHRFTTYKAATDTTISQLRNETNILRDDLARAINALQAERTQQQEVQSDPFENVFSQEDEDTFGAEGLNVVKKATASVLEKQVKPLQEQLKQAEIQRAKDLQAQAERSRQAEYGGFLENLEILVPNYRELNVNKEFLEWMKLPDVYSGLERGHLFRKAEAGRDVARVAEFFVEFKHAKETTQPIPKDMERHVTPVGTGVATAPSTTKGAEEQIVYTSEIDKFYADVTKGYYEGRESEVLNIEAQIERAAMSNNIRKG